MARRATPPPIVWVPAGTPATRAAARARAWARLLEWATAAPAAGDSAPPAEASAPETPSEEGPPCASSATPG